MATLYELSTDYQRLLDYAEDMDPTLFHDTLDSIDDAIENKAENYAKVSKNMEQEISSIEGKIKPFEDEVKRLKAKIKVIKNNQDRLKINLRDAMNATGKNKIKTDLFSISISHSFSVAIDDVDKIPSDLVKVTKSADKTVIGKELRAGINIDGVHLETSESVQIR